MIQTTHPRFANFKPELSLARSWIGRASKRLDLERENLKVRGAGYFQERSHRAWEVARARAAITIDNFKGNGQTSRSGASMAYILEVLGAEHDRAFENYVPSPYSGDVLLFRARKQILGIDDRTLGWSGLLHGNLTVCEVPGHQQNMLVDPNLSGLAEELKSSLRDAQRRYAQKTERRRG